MALVLVINHPPSSSFMKAIPILTDAGPLRPGSRPPRDRQHGPDGLPQRVPRRRVGRGRGRRLLRMRHRHPGSQVHQEGEDAQTCKEVDVVHTTMFTYVSKLRSVFCSCFQLNLKVLARETQLFFFSHVSTLKTSLCCCGRHGSTVLLPNFAHVSVASCLLPLADRP